MMQKFTWFVDMNTSATALQVVKITAGGNPVKNRLAPFFGAYKYFKLGPVSVRFVPASTLPVDPTGLSLEAGANTVDPRDQFNPGLIRITNGEDMADDFMDLSGTNIDKTYYSMMLDRRWFKFQLQTGCRRTAKPLFWSVGQLHQDAFPGATRMFLLLVQLVEQLRIRGQFILHVVALPKLLMNGLPVVPVPADCSRRVSKRGWVGFQLISSRS